MKARSFLFAILFLAGCLTGVRPVSAAGEVTVAKINSEQLTPHEYKVSGIVNNYSTEDRELILRAQIAFYRTNGMEGESPAWILRKDITRILHGGESQLIEVKLIDDSGPPKGAFRQVPMLRVRRNREWKY